MARVSDFNNGVAAVVAMAIVALASTARAEFRAELVRGRGMLILHIDVGEGDPLFQRGAGNAAFQCRARQQDDIAAGCYIGVTRDAKAVAPAFLPSSGRDGVWAPRTLNFRPSITGAATVTVMSPTVENDDPRELLAAVSLSGSLAVALALYSECNAKTQLHCVNESNISYRFGVIDPIASFAVAPDGSVRAYKHEAFQVAADAVPHIDFPRVITYIDAATYEVPDETRHQVMSTLVEYAKGARVVPAWAGGKPYGYKLYSIRPSSLFAALGLQNGDHIKMINSYPLDKTESINGALSALCTANSITVAIERRGKPLTLIWRIK